MKWNPIETIPNDRAVLCYAPADPDSEWLAHEKDRYAVCSLTISGHIVDDVTGIITNDFDAHDQDFYFNPTHWADFDKFDLK